MDSRSLRSVRQFYNHSIGKFMPRWLDIFNAISTTNARIFFTLFLAAGTAVHYWTTGDAPDSNWLLFLGALAGIDVAQFHSKRKTTFPPAAQQNNGDQESTASTDLRELSERG